MFLRRVALVLVLLGLGLSRLVRSDETHRIATVVLLDVSDSVADATLQKARAEVERLRARGVQFRNEILSGPGGSQIRDATFYADELIIRYRPSRIVVYSGDNDIDAGRTPQQVLADFRAYSECQQQVGRAYNDQAQWHRMAALNCARSGKFSSDRTIRDYAREIWHALPAGQPGA